ncbi:hypothetical protein C2845_PM04G07970 [Panicum miliaceum]|uniref:Protein TIC 22-like, chloroplastic n=1 Tax=Panicum miliaceum TaxID=4540 RepID=A0A3L6QLV3_PANMI|nr:hypothetical protein C2845_PM04G07970 [Panicum miliaceum]
MPFQFQFPWLKNPTTTTTAAGSSNPNPSPSHSPSIPNPFLPIQAHLTSFLSSLPRALPPPPPWARIPSPSPSWASATPLPPAEIEERLAGVPVYALANAAHEIVLMSSARAGGQQGREGAKPPAALGLLCFRKEDADALLEQMEGDMRAGSSVVPVALNKLMQDEGLYVREGFPGVPVFQLRELEVILTWRNQIWINLILYLSAVMSRSLVLMSDNKRYRPVFFRKEDLDNSLYRTSRDQQKPNPAVRLGDTQVSSLEDIIKSMKDSSSSKWDDVVFIPPGFDLATGSKPSHLNK